MTTIAPPPTPGSACFVGRRDWLDELCAGAAGGGIAFIPDTVGAPGVGKSTLIWKLWQRLKAEAGLRCAFVPMTKFDSRAAGADASEVLRLQRSIDFFKRLLAYIARQLPDKAAAAFADAIQDPAYGLEEQSPIVVSSNTSIGMGTRIKAGRDVTIGERVDSTLWIPVLENARERAAREFVALANSLGRIVVVVDDFQVVLKQLVDEWFLDDVVAQLEEPAVLLFRTAVPTPLHCGVELVEHRQIANFSAAETAEYLKRRLEKVSAEAIDYVFEFTDGHPQAVALAADVVADRPSDDLAALLGDVSAEPRQRLIELVDLICENVSDDLCEALEVGVIVRRFDEQLLEQLTGPSEENSSDSHVRSHSLLERLKAYSFIQPVDPDRSLYKLHDFIRETKSAELAAKEPARWRLLHERAERYYAERLLDFEEGHGDATSWRRWYRYETLEWQELMMEWLFHVAKIGGRSARLSFAQLYLDAFWWWGWYWESPFCVRLLKEWGETQAEPESVEIGEVLAKFHVAYPPQGVPGASGDWKEVRSALGVLLQLLRLDPGIAHIKDKTGRHVRAMIDLFLAHARRGIAPSDPKIYTLYAEAARIFGPIEDDRWNLAWIEYEQGDLAAQLGDEKNAIQRSDAALRLAFDPDVPAADRDYEVIANSHRVRADVALRAGDIMFAVRSYGCAGANAYAFQASCVPDYYTRAFYREITGKAVDALIETASTHPDEVSEACTELRESWHPYFEREQTDEPGSWKPLLAAERRTELLAALFPREPTDEELDVSSTEYLKRVQAVCAELAETTLAPNVGK